MQGIRIELAFDVDHGRPPSMLHCIAYFDRIETPSRQNFYGKVGKAGQPVVIRQKSVKPVFHGRGQMQ